MARKSSDPLDACFSEQNSRFKRSNEDAGVSGILYPGKSYWVRFAAVADGISGLDEGAAASAMAVRRFVTAVESLRADWKPETVEDHFFAAFEKLNEEIISLSDRGAGTTFTGIVESRNWILLIHVGDSVCFEVGGGKSGREVNKLSCDHTEVAAAKRAGKKEDEIDQLHQHSLAHSLGDPVFSVDIDWVRRTHSHSWFVLASDGITDALGSTEFLLLRESATSLQEFCETACRKALHGKVNGGKPNKDNITIAVLRGFRKDMGKPGIRWVGSARRDEGDEKPDGKVIPNQKMLSLAGIGILGIFLLAGFCFAFVWKQVQTKPEKPSSSGQVKHDSVMSDQNSILESHNPTGRSDPFSAKSRRSVEERIPQKYGFSADEVMEPSESAKKDPFDVIPDPPEVIPDPPEVIPDPPRTYKARKGDTLISIYKREKRENPEWVLPREQWMDEFVRINELPDRNTIHSDHDYTLPSLRQD